LARSNTLAYAALAVVCSVWGTTYLAIRIAVETIPPFLLTAVRYTTAGLILLAIARMRGEPLPRSKRVLGELALVGFLLVCLGNLSVVWAEQWVPSGPAALFVATAPFWAALLERLRKDGERVTLGATVGMVLGFVGVAMLVTPTGAGAYFNTEFVLGVLAIQAGCVAWQYGTSRAKYNLRELTPVVSSGLQMLAGGIVVGIVGFAIGEAPRFRPSTGGLLALAYLSTIGAVLAYTAYIYAVRHLPMSIASLYAYVNPVVAVILGWLILNEQLTWVSIAAMCVILVGVALVQSNRIARA
jgi:drug/metabolite transporter (DMT)-like permease